MELQEAVQSLLQMIQSFIGQAWNRFQGKNRLRNFGSMVSLAALIKQVHTSWSAHAGALSMQQTFSLFLNYLLYSIYYLRICVHFNEAGPADCISATALLEICVHTYSLCRFSQHSAMSSRMLAEATQTDLDRQSIHGLTISPPPTVKSLDLKFKQC